LPAAQLLSRGTCNPMQTQRLEGGRRLPCRALHSSAEGQAGDAMVAKGTKILLLVPNEGNQRILHPGEVIESDAQGYVVEFDEPIAPAVGANVNAYGDVRGRFYQQGAVVAAIRQTEPHPVIAFTRVGDPVSAENRQTFRVCVAMSGIFAT